MVLKRVLLSIFGRIARIILTLQTSTLFDFNLGHFFTTQLNDIYL
jgi:hypothetical protein